VAVIELHEARIPFYQAQSQEDIDEAKRLFYAGVTRAKRLLFYITDSSNRRNRPTRFLGDDEGVGGSNDFDKVPIAAQHGIVC
jgi:DNA helicase-2/ATP-dependent DNA helicase PcrA